MLLSLLVGRVLATGVQAAPAQAASPSTKVKALISKIIKSKHPKKTYYSLSKANRAVVRKELKSGTVRLRVVRTPASTNVSPNSGATASCWQKSLEAAYMGGKTRNILFKTTQTTSVCVVAGTVSEVTLPQRFQDTLGLGWHPDGVGKATLDVNWEGRGVALGKFKWGAGGWYLYHSNLCAQLRLNRDFSHYAASQACSVQA